MPRDWSQRTQYMWTPEKRARSTKEQLSFKYCPSLMRFNNCHLRSFVQLLLIAELKQAVFLWWGGGDSFLMINTDRTKAWNSGGAAHFYSLLEPQCHLLCCEQGTRETRLKPSNKMSKWLIECVFICSFFQTLMNVLCEPITVVLALCVRTQWALSSATPNISASAASHRTRMATVSVRLLWSWFHTPVNKTYSSKLLIKWDKIKWGCFVSCVSLGSAWCEKSLTSTAEICS